MWDCRRVEARAVDLLEGGLGLRSRLGLWPHLALCPDCRTYLRQLRATIGLLGALPAEPPSAATEARLLAAFRARRGG